MKPVTRTGSGSGAKGLSVYGNKLGIQVAAPGVSVIDDATIPGKYGFLRFDDEGIPGQRTVLIEDGQLVGYITTDSLPIKTKWNQLATAAVNLTSINLFPV